MKATRKGDPIMGLFGHKKHVYVFWGRFNDAADIDAGNAVIHQLGTKEVALTIDGPDEFHYIIR